MLALCTVVPGHAPAASSQPTVTFNPTPVAGAHWMQGIAEKYGLFLSPAGIFALDRHTAFLFGSMNTAAGSFKSVLLRTSDGGSHWFEILPPQASARVERVAFTPDGGGWVLLRSSPAEPFILFHTRDHGRHWRQLPGAAPAECDGQVTGMAFSDANNGRITLRYPTATPGSYRNGFLSTMDGGKSWQETASVFADGGEAPAPTTGSVAADGTRWKIDTKDAERTVVSRQPPGKRGWEVVSIFTGRFAYSAAGR